MGQLGIFQRVQVVEAGIDERLVGQGPELFGQLQLGRIWWQEQQVDMLGMRGHTGPLAGMPARLVEHQDNLFAWARSHCLGKRGQFRLEERNQDPRGQVPDGAPGGGVDEADQIAPAVEVLAAAAPRV